MHSDNQNKQNPLKPVIAGAALGAVVAAGAVIMSDKKKRKQVIDTMHTMKDKTDHIMHEAKAKVDELRDNVEDLREDAETMLEDADKIKRKLS